MQQVPQNPQTIRIRDLRPSVLANVNTSFIILEKSPPTREGNLLMSVATVADASAAVNFQLWGSECDSFQPGDIVRLTNGIFSFHKTNLVLRAGKKGFVEKVGEFTMVFVEAPNLSLLQWVQDPSDPKVWMPLPPAQPSSSGLLPGSGGFLGNPRSPH